MEGSAHLRGDAPEGTEQGPARVDELDLAVLGERLWVGRQPSSVLHMQRRAFKFISTERRPAFLECARVSPSRSLPGIRPSNERVRGATETLQHT
jgi:hypothetical protein